MKGRVSGSEIDVENEGARETERERGRRERSGQGSKSRQWLKSLLPLSTSTRTSTRRNLSSWSEEKEISVLAFLYSPSLLSLSPSFSPSNFLTSSLLPATPPCPAAARQIYFTFLPFLDLSQYLAALWHPGTGRGGHRSPEDTALSPP